MKAIIKQKDGKVVEYELFYGYNPRSAWPHWYSKVKNQLTPTQHNSDNLDTTLKELIKDGELIDGDFEKGTVYRQKSKKLLCRPDGGRDGSGMLM